MDSNHAMKPEVFGEYLLLSPVAGQAMCEVFIGVQLGDRSGRLLVIKRPPLGERSSGQVAESLRREAAALGAQPLANSVRLVTSGEIAGLPYVVLEHIAGVSLGRLLEDGAFSEPERQLIARELGLALSAVHERGLVHGDVAPDNVMIDEEGELFLVDFGLARPAGGRREGPSGKPGYTSPESALGQPAQPSDDVYAWGLLAAECGWGRPMFDEQDLAQAALRSAELPRALSEVTWLKRALDRDPNNRPPITELVGLIEKPAAEVRAGLAARVAGQAASGPQSRHTKELPSAPPQVARAVATRSSQTPSFPAGALEPTSRESTQAPRKSGVAPMLVLGSVVLALVVGAVVGRRTVRAAEQARGATMTLPVLPPRTKITVDGNNILVPEAGRSLPLEVGKHTISIGDDVSYDVHVQPGDHLVIVPVGRARTKGRN